MKSGNNKERSFPKSETELACIKVQINLKIKLKSTVIKYLNK